jgi:hypothetical protein
MINGLRMEHAGSRVYSLIVLSSLALIVPGRLNRIMNAVVPASRVRGMMAKMFKKTLAKPQPQVKPQTGVTSRNGKNRTLRRSKDIRVKENAPEFDYSSFYVTTGTGKPAALLHGI